MENYWKHRLNILLAYHRRRLWKETRDDKWKQKHFYVDDAKGILLHSITTISRMEQNKITVDDETYLFALHKMAMSINVSNEVEALFTTYIHDMYLAIWHYDLDAIQSICKHIKQVPIQANDIYYQELLYVFDLIQKYYQYRGFSISDQDFQHMHKLMALYPTELQEIVMDFLFLYANTHNNDYEDLLFNTYDYEHSTYLPNQLNYIYKLYYNENYLQAYNMLRQLEDIAETDQNDNQLVVIYGLKCVILRRIDTEEYKRALQKTEKLLDVEKLTEKRKTMLLQNLIFSYIRMKQYEKALIYLKMILSKDTCPHVMKHISCYHFCCRQLKIDIPKKYLKKVNENNVDAIDKALYEYYLYYEKRDSASNLRYITCIILPELSRCSSSLYLDMIDQEIYNLCVSLNRYKSYTTFKRQFSV